METSESRQAIELLERHTSALRDADNKYHDERNDHLKDLVDANDRRYAEVNVEKEKALKIKETADAEALKLAREAQSYKDQQTDKLRDETLGKTGIYATNKGVADALKELEGTFFNALNKLVDDLKPLTDFMSKQQGADGANALSRAKIYSIAVVIATLGGGTIAAILKAFGL